MLLHSSPSLGDTLFIPPGGWQPYAPPPPPGAALKALCSRAWRWERAGCSWREQGEDGGGRVGGQLPSRGGGREKRPACLRGRGGGGLRASAPARTASAARGPPSGQPPLRPKGQAAAREPPPLPPAAAAAAGGPGGGRETERQARFFSGRGGGGRPEFVTHLRSVEPPPQPAHQQHRGGESGQRLRGTRPGAPRLLPPGPPLRAHWQPHDTARPSAADGQAPRRPRHAPLSPLGAAPPGQPRGGRGREGCGEEALFTRREAGSRRALRIRTKSESRGRPEGGGRRGRKREREKEGKAHFFRRIQKS